MGNRIKHSRHRENSDDNQLNEIVMPAIIAWSWSGIGAIPGLPASTLTLEWLVANNISEEYIRNTGIYNPVYKEEINGTRTKSTSENSDGERDTGERDTSSILHESESSGGDVE